MRRAVLVSRTVENGGFHGGASEISREGRKDLPMRPDCITGYSVITAESLEEAERIAGENPFIKAIRVYEIVEHQGRFEAAEILA